MKLVYQKCLTGKVIMNLNDMSTMQILVWMIVFFMLSIITLIGMVLVLKVSNVDKNSPQVDGIILTSEASTGPVADRGSSVRASGYSWTFKITYEYYYKEKKYNGGSLYNGNDFATVTVNNNDFEYKKPARINDLETLFPIGKEIKVYVNDKNPKFSFLIYRKRLGGYLIALALFFIFLGTGIFYLTQYLKR